MRSDDLSPEILAGAADNVSRGADNLGNDAALLAAFCADLRATFGGEPVDRDRLPRWRKRESMLQSLLTSTAAKVGVTTAAALLGFGGVAAAGALPAPVQHEVASVADHVGLGFVPDPQDSHATNNQSTTENDQRDATDTTDTTDTTPSTEPNDTPGTEDNGTVPPNADTHAGGETDHGKDGESHGNSGDSTPPDSADTHSGDGTDHSSEGDHQSGDNGDTTDTTTPEQHDTPTTSDSSGGDHSGSDSTDGSGDSSSGSSGSDSSSSSDSQTQSDSSSGDTSTSSPVTP